MYLFGYPNSHIPFHALKRSFLRLINVPGNNKNVLGSPRQVPPYVLTNFNQIRNVLAGFRKSAQYQSPRKSRDRCGKAGKRTDMTQLTGRVFPPPLLRDQREVKFLFHVKFFLRKSAQPFSPAVTRADGQTGTARFYDSSPGRFAILAARAVQPPVLPVYEQAHWVNGQHLASVTRLHCSLYLRGSYRRREKPA